MSSKIAVVGIACRYADVTSPEELWNNILAGRRAFRRIPPERLRIEDYISFNELKTESLSTLQAAVIKDYEFDRVAFKVSGKSYRSADLTHWLALDLATQALDDAGFPKGEGLPRESTGVIVGNTLTGEFSRANVLRLRWPYVRKVVGSLLSAKGYSEDDKQRLLSELEVIYKRPFEPVNEETLAGGLANTIAGRICNYYDLHGGGFTVDGACSSSLIAIYNACQSLSYYDLDVAIVGGVDLSLDPFELIGFSATQALAKQDMRVYDAHSQGFWPGEGCGFLVLMREEDAILQGKQIYAVLTGWGMSSDGAGGLTRPSVEGQKLALKRAYKKAGYEINTVSYFEGHGTGTKVGDQVELTAISEAIKESGGITDKITIGSVKANIGHTKAAAGVAGLIKAIMALQQQMLPPNSGNIQSHPYFKEDSAVLQLLPHGQLWPKNRPLRAGVSSMGFGGINVHITLESRESERRSELTSEEYRLLNTKQDAELFVWGDNTLKGLHEQIQKVLNISSNLSHAELTDVAVALFQQLPKKSVYRAAVVASTPQDFMSKIQLLDSWLIEGRERAVGDQVYLGNDHLSPRFGFLFTGQGAPVRSNSGWIGKRFCEVSRYDMKLPPVASGQIVDTSIMQPAIVRSSLAGLRALEALGIEAKAVLGHSLGELTALHWSGALTEEDLLRTVEVRGHAMSTASEVKSTMASIAVSQSIVRELLLDQEAVWVSAVNGANQTVISGSSKEVQQVIDKAKSRGWRATKLNVSHAFHSPFMAEAAKSLAAHLKSIQILPVNKRVFSTVTGRMLEENTNIEDLLVTQLTDPVLFTDALVNLVQEVDVLIEVGPGRILTELASEMTNLPVLPMDVGSDSAVNLLNIAGISFALGAKVSLDNLFDQRYAKPFSFGAKPNFFINPCELVEVENRMVVPIVVEENEEILPSYETEDFKESTGTTITKTQILDTIRQHIAEKTELPLSEITESSHMLDDLHLNSIAIGQLIVQVARSLNLNVPTSVMEFSDSTIEQAAEGLFQQVLIKDGNNSFFKSEKEPQGLEAWIRTFTVVQEPAKSLSGIQNSEKGDWIVIAPPNYQLTNELQQTLQNRGGKGVIVVLTSAWSDSYFSYLLESVKLIFDMGNDGKLVFVLHDNPGAAFARSLHQEYSQLSIAIVQLPLDENAVDRIVQEALSDNTYIDVQYDMNGFRSQSVMRVHPLLEEEQVYPIDSHDVLLVTGGGKGIAAECALALARETGVRLALVGRSNPEQDPVLAENLNRFSAQNVDYVYISADVTDDIAIEKAVKIVEEKFGPVTALLHAAGTNLPKRISQLTTEDMKRTMSVKVDGLNAVLKALNPSKLRLMVTFGSIIGRIGMHGNADYAIANEYMTKLTEQFAQTYPTCKTCSMEWSVWSGMGMGESLGQVNILLQQGITPITVEEGVRVFLKLLRQTSLPNTLVITGRLGASELLPFEKRELPILRFLENIRAYYHGVELISDVKLSLDTDPYLKDHMFGNDAVFPGVMGLEAIAQCAMAVLGKSTLPIFEDVKFIHPIVVDSNNVILRFITNVLPNGEDIEIVVRSSSTDYKLDYIRARVRFNTKFESQFTELPELDSEFINADELYKGFLFQRGRFQRLIGYHKLHAKTCIAKVQVNEAHWFGAYLPGELITGDVGSRDAVIHCIQACIPNKLILPTGVDSLAIFERAQTEVCYVQATERCNKGDIFKYDVTVYDQSGKVLEFWRGLQLHVVQGQEREIDVNLPWLIGPYLERALEDLNKGEVSIRLRSDTEKNRIQNSNLTMQAALGQFKEIYRRPDGKPLTTDEYVSASHKEGLTLAVASKQIVSCDLEIVIAKSVDVWSDLLGHEDFLLASRISKHYNESLDLAATRVWSAKECLKKAGLPSNAPIVMNDQNTNRSVVLMSGSALVMTDSLVFSHQDTLIAAILIKEEPSCVTSNIVMS